MSPARWKLPVAVVAAVVIAEAAVWLLRPEERLHPVPVSESRFFSAHELERARDYGDGQRLLGLAAIAVQGGMLTLLVVRRPRRAIRAAERAARGLTVLATAIVGGGLI